MPYVTCTGCGTRSYAPPPLARPADCPVCDTRLLDPRVLAATERRWWSRERSAEAARGVAIGAAHRPIEIVD
jgi:hypothetical protein